MLYPFGSQLAKKLYQDFRNPKDLDWVTNIESDLMVSNRNEEYYYIPCTPNREMTANELYTLKVSHAIYDIQWTKTMSDIRFFQIKGCDIEYGFLNELRDYWKTIHTAKQRTNFEIEESKFFKDNVKREIPHDDLHRIFNPSPAYLNIVDGITPIEDKFNVCSDELKDAICFEEAYVLAVERYCNKLQYRDAYYNAQKDLITRLHPIWLADYIITNWNKKFWITKNNYYELFKTRTNRED